MTTVADISHWSIPQLIWYIRQYVSPTTHFYATREELVWNVAKLMEANGELDPSDAKVLNTPGLEKIFIIEGGDLTKTLAHFAVDTQLSFLSYLHQ